MKLCAGCGLMPSLPINAAVEAFKPTRLLKQDGSPLKAAEVGTGEAMVFAYPYRGIPCFLINLGDAEPHSQQLVAPDGRMYTNPAAVGGSGNVVAFVAICTHQLSYPKPTASFLHYAATAHGPGDIVCCVHGSVFEPAAGARVRSGPAPAPLLPVWLEHDPATDGLVATKTVDKAFLNRFFDAYKGELIQRFGAGEYDEPVGPATIAVALSDYADVVVTCSH